MIWDVVVNIVSEFVFLPISFALGLLGFAIKGVIARKKYKRKLKFENNLNKIQFITANPESKDSQEHANLGYVFEYMSVGELQSTWMKNFKGIEIGVQMSLPSTIQNEQIPEENLLIIGGPFHNQMCRNVLNRYKSVFPFYWKRVGDEDAVLHFEYEGEIDTYTPVLVVEGEKKYYGKDYALIVNVKNVLDSQKRLMLLIGCRAMGCLGGAIFLSQHMDKISENDLPEEYAMVVRMTGDEDQITSGPYLEKIYKLDTTNLK